MVDSGQTVFLPRAVQDLVAPCSKCGSPLKPRFWEWSDGPYVPIFPKGTNGEAGAWVQTSTFTSCVCGGQANFDLNARKLEHPIFFFGDEAEREHDGKLYHGYSLIGGTSGPIKDLSDALRELKALFVRDVDPNDWRIHVTAMRNARSRPSDPVYRVFDEASLRSFFHGCASILKANEHVTWNSHVSAGILRPKTKKEQRLADRELKATCHMAILSAQIYRATQQGLRPKFTLDATKARTDPKRGEGWSWTPYLGSRHQLAYAFITASNEIAPPEFVPPGSHLCLELADVHAYFLGQTYFRRQSGLEPDIDPSEFGKFNYLSVLGPSYCENNVADQPTSPWYNKG